MPACGRYRPDIDALRGIAVLAVVVFHVFPDALPGGFLGVDVFFVISGYLITGILLREQADGSFSLSGFYGRRVRRILPSLIIVLLACGGAGWWVLLSREYGSLGQHTAAAAAFLSNFTLWHEAGYFDEMAHTKPLLHLWSLAIEEQFYVAWPLAMWMVGKVRLDLLKIAVVFAFLSLLSAVHFAQVDPDGGFYAPAARAWELLGGAFLAIAEHRRHALASATWRQASLAGMVMIASAMALVHPAAGVPPWLACLPVAGAVLVIAAGAASAVNTRLSSPWLVAFGKISYPLYLWHWPLLSVSRIVVGRDLPSQARWSIVALSLALAWLTWRFVEQPLRRLHLRGLVPGLVAALASVGVVGHVIHAKDGLPDRAQIARFEAQARGLGRNDRAAVGVDCGLPEMTQPPVLNFCRRSRDALPTVALLGDSHADHLLYGLASLDGERTWLLLANSSMPPLLGVDMTILGEPLRPRAEKAIAYLVADPHIQTVVVSFMLTFYISDVVFAADHLRLREPMSALISMSSPGRPEATRAELAYDGLLATIDALQSAGKSVIVVLPVPELPFFPRDCMTRPGSELFVRDCVLRSSVAAQRQQPARALLQRLHAARPDVVVFDPFPLLCDPDQCRFTGNDGILYRDSHHLAPAGSKLVAAGLLRELAALEHKPRPKVVHDVIATQ
jgi:peptidoglycan/LPS O-acetylase OafA/YrhL